VSLIFECNRCPATYRQFKDIVGHYETCHNEEGKQFRYKTDDVGYADSDSGCKQATAYLGHQSSCLHCPFRKCILDELGVGIARAKKRTRNEEIIQRLSKGESISDIAEAFGVSIRTIQRVMKQCREDG